MMRRLDMGKCGFPLDLFRKFNGVNGAVARGVVVGGASNNRQIVKRRVRVAGRASDDSDFRTVFKGIELFSALSVYAHGSWGDGTMTPFSDFDDLVIVDYKLVSDARELSRMEDFLHEVDMRFCRLDPLQHHGHWIVARDELELLDESYIPLSVLENSICVQGDSEIEYGVDIVRSKAGARRNVLQTCEVIERLYPTYVSGRINHYEMKRLAGSFFILPAYVFQAKGAVISKRDAIYRCAELFGSAACELMANCTVIRNEWGRVVETPEFRRFHRIGKLFRNGNLHRRYAHLMAGRFPVQGFPRLGAGGVSQFIEEARAHASD